MILEIVSVIVLLLVMVVITWSSVKLIDSLEGMGFSFVPAAWLTTAWSIIATLALSTFILGLIKTVLGA